MRFLVRRLELASRLLAEFKRRPLMHVLGALVLLSTVLSSISSAVSYGAQGRAEDALDAVEAEADERILQACLALNRNRRDSRALMQRGDFESGEALIETVTMGNTTPEELAAIDTYRRLLAQKQQNIVEQHELDDLNCSDPELALELQGR